MDTGEAGQKKRENQNKIVMRNLMDYSRYKVSLELVQVDVERSIEPQGRGDGGHNLRDETVEVAEARGDNTETLLADVVDCLVVNLHRYSQKGRIHWCSRKHTMKEQSECSRVVWVVRTEL